MSQILINKFCFHVLCPNSQFTEIKTKTWFKDFNKVHGYTRVPKIATFCKFLSLLGLKKDNAIDFLVFKPGHFLFEGVMPHCNNVTWCQVTWYVTHLTHDHLDDLITLSGWSSGHFVIIFINRIMKIFSNHWTQLIKLRCRV